MILAIIQARMSSRRLPDKVMKEIMGRPMLWYQIERLRQSRLIDRIVIATTRHEADKPILKLAADLGLNPAVDGQLIRLPVPPLNEERRKELVKRCKQLAEEGRVAVRNIRRDANDQIKKSEKDKELSEDQAKDGHDETQKLTDDHIKQIDEMLEKKEKDVMEV